MIIIINTITGLVEINQTEKEKVKMTAPNLQSPIQYNQIDIKRKYYKKGDPKYKRKPLTKTILKSLRSGRIVKQEPLLDLCY